MLYPPGSDLRKEKIKIVGVVIIIGPGMNVSGAIRDKDGIPGRKGIVRMGEISNSGNVAVKIINRFVYTCGIGNTVKATA